MKRFNLIALILAVVTAFSFSVFAQAQDSTQAQVKKRFKTKTMVQKKTQTGTSGTMMNNSAVRHGNRFIDLNGDGYEDLAVTSQGKAWFYFNPLGRIHARETFVRGNANGDGSIDVADAIAVLQFLFAGGNPLPCMDAADVNDDETLNIADPIRLLGWLFGGGNPPPPPNSCGTDPEGDHLDCKESVCP